MILGLYLVVHWATQVLANIAFKLGSAPGADRRRWLTGFVAGNAVGTISIFFFTLICRQLPHNPNLATVLAGGGTFIGCQVVLALVFGTRLRGVQWTGIALVAGGLILAGLGGKGPG